MMSPREARNPIVEETEQPKSMSSGNTCRLSDLLQSSFGAIFSAIRLASTSRGRRRVVRTDIDVALVKGL
jgi:hypothetical protein